MFEITSVKLECCESDTFCYDESIRLLFVMMYYYLLYERKWTIFYFVLARHLRASHLSIHIYQNIFKWNILAIDSFRERKKKNNKKLLCFRRHAKYHNKFSIRRICCLFFKMEWYTQYISHNHYWNVPLVQFQLELISVFFSHFAFQSYNQQFIWDFQRNTLFVAYFPSVFGYVSDSLHIR